MPCYEHVFIVRQDVPSQQVDTLIDEFSEVVQQSGGTVAKKENWGLKSLAYRIKKNRKGHYVLMNIDAPAEAIHEMERQMRIHEDVLRYMTIRVDELDEEPSIQMQAKSSRDERAKRRRDDRDDDDRPRGENRPTETPAAETKDETKPGSDDEKPAAEPTTEAEPAAEPATEAEPAKETEEVT